MPQNPFDQFDAETGVIPISPPDPRRPLEIDKLRQEIARGAQSAQTAPALTAAELQAKRLANEKATLDLATQRREAAMQTTVDPAIAQAIRGMGLTELLEGVAAARREVGTGRATGITGAIMRNVPGSSAIDLTKSLEQIKGAIILEKLQALKDASKTGASGMGALSEREGDRLAASVAALDANMSDEKLRESLSAIERHAKALQAVSQGKNPDDPKVQKQFGIVVDRPDVAGGVVNADGSRGDGPGGTPPADGGGRPDNVALSKDGTTITSDPALVGANAKVASMIRAGRSAKEIRSYLDTVQPGLGGRAKNIEQWIAYSNRNPGKPIDVRLDRVTKQLTPAGSLLNDAAQSDVGAGIAKFADSISMGTLDNLSSNPALTRAGLAGLGAEHPNSSLAGSVLGQTALSLGAEGLASVAGAGRLASLIAGDVLPSAGYGAGSADEGSRLAGAGLGGLAGFGGGVAGRGLGRVISGAADPAVNFLAQRGIRLTPGQMLGGVPKRVEDAATSIPLVGDVIRGQRRRGVEDFNRAAFGEALEPIGQVAGGQVGEAGIQNAEQLIGQAYDSALGGAQVRIDPQFGTELGGAVNRMRAIPRVGDEVADTVGQIVPPYFSAAGELSGRDMQPMLRELRGFRSGYRGDPLGERVADTVQDAEGAVTGLFDRQAPDVMPAFNAANEAYSRFAPLQDAVLAAAKTNDGVFMPSQLGTAVVNGTKRYAGKGAAARGDRAFFDLQRNAQNVLPSTIADSGTPGRLMIAGALGIPTVLGTGAGAASGGTEGAVEGGSTGLAGTALLGGALLSPYAGRALLQQLLTGARPQAVRTIGDVVGRSRLPGALAVPLLAGGS